MIHLRNSSRLLTGAAMLALIVLAGCGGKKEDEEMSREELAKQILPDSLPFTEKINRLTMLSFQNLQQLVDNHPDERRDFAVATNALMPRNEFFKLFEDKDVTFYNLYYGIGNFSGVYPVDPSLPIDSTVSLLNLEARSRLAENLRIGNEEVANITDEMQRGRAEDELEKLRHSLEELDEEGEVSYHGCELQALPGDMMSLMNAPDRPIRVIFPGNPSEGSWVRLSPYRMQLLIEQDRQTALQ
jgi:hypothetical protein